MTRSEVVTLFESMKCDRHGAVYAPHKPILVLLLLEMIATGHENSFAYRDLDGPLSRLLKKFGSRRSADARNEPYWRLQNDGILNVTFPFSTFVAGITPSPTQLVGGNAYATMSEDLYASLRSVPGVLNDVAQAIATKFLQADVRRPIVAEAAPTIARLTRNYWWVSQNRTYRDEINGNYMWSPKTNSSGGFNPNYEFMKAIVPGDIVYSYSGSQIKAIGVAISEAASSPKPSEFGTRGKAWLDDGWLVEVAFYELGQYAIKPSEHMDIIAPTLPNRYAPIRPDGHGNQMYLAPIPRAMAEVMNALIGPSSDAITDDVTARLFQEVDRDDVEDIDTIEHRTDIGATEKRRLVKARRGQGLFRIVVSLVEPRCRITQAANKLHLVASHIKPWSESTDDERLDRYNGLLLSPHADHLFDKGWLSFKNTGEIIVAEKLDRQVLEDWHIDVTRNVGRFHREQEAFLEYHRDIVLKR